MKRWHWILLAFFSLYAAAWLAAWLHFRATGSRAWMEGLKVGIQKIGRVNGGIVLSVFYLVILPFFAVFFIARDALGVRTPAKTVTYWLDVPPGPTRPDRATRPF